MSKTLDGVGFDIGRQIRDTDEINICHNAVCARMYKGIDSDAGALLVDEYEPRQPKSWYLGEYKVTVNNGSAEVLSVTLVATEANIHEVCGGDAIGVGLSLEDLA